MKTLKIGKCYFRGLFLSIPKIPKISTNTNGTKLFLLELNDVGDTLQFEYKFGYSQIAAFISI